MVRDKHVVTMKHYWEVDIGLSESAKNLTLDDLQIDWFGAMSRPSQQQLGFLFSIGIRGLHEPKVNNSKRQRLLDLGPWTVSIDKNVRHCPLSKSASWPLGVIFKVKKRAVHPSNIILTRQLSFQFSSQSDCYNSTSTNVLYCAYKQWSWFHEVFFLVLLKSNAILMFFYFNIMIVQ